ncbi:hypothetical protein D3OALGA1CA_5 [Olavius algarvensis associated proteobacterium Delta 3]|nr:hypothetical protein D3OALGA1CA_5 [Olavius algarvensis associated proteobacterium Delta 3]CAB5099272.1 hypothetical protein D3OALGB2SA_1719 [Olavius algarvensis associated proteobacterium Delta 3]
MQGHDGGNPFRLGFARPRHRTLVLPITVLVKGILFHSMD